MFRVAQKRESKLWQRIKKLKLDAQIFRIESNTINGIPDVYILYKGRTVWLELKSNDLKNYGLSKWQINWHLTHLKNGGTAYILGTGVKHRALKLLGVEGSGSVGLVSVASDTEAGLRKLILLVSRAPSLTKQHWSGLLQLRMLVKLTLLVSPRLV